jgi:hypothetical protein
VASTVNVTLAPADKATVRPSLSVKALSMGSRTVLELKDDRVKSSPVGHMYLRSWLGPIAYHSSFSGRASAREVACSSTHFTLYLVSI